MIQKNPNLTLLHDAIGELNPLVGQLFLQFVEALGLTIVTSHFEFQFLNINDRSALVSP